MVKPDSAHAGQPMKAVMLLVALLVGACAGTSRDSASGAPFSSASQSAALPSPSTPSTSPPVSPTASESSLGTARPSVDPSARHEDPQLEGQLPASVVGQPLYRWSVRGTDYFSMDPANVANLEGIKSNLAQLGLAIDDVSEATAGRALLRDPPYFVIAIRFKGIAADQLPPQLGVQDLGNPQASFDSGWQAVTIAGKAIERGRPDMIGVSEHIRGTPYAYNHGDVRFVVVSDNAAWVADALRQLP